MSVPFANVGYNTHIQGSRVLCVMPPESSPIKRLVQVARDEGKAIDITYGRKTRAIVLFDTGHVVISPVNPDTLVAKFNNVDAPVPAIPEDE